MSSFAYDVFISYSSKDAAWVRAELLPQLESHGLRVCIDFRDFVIGAPSVEEMQRAVLTSRHTLLVLSPNYIASAWTNFERLMTQTLDPDNRARRIIPLLHAPCDVPISIGYLNRIDFSAGQDWNRLVGALR